MSPTLTTIDGKLRVSGGAIVLSESEEKPCCCDSYEFCVVNSNNILDNAWDVLLNGKLLGNYSGERNTNVCFDIDGGINPAGQNTLRFERTDCKNDDYFEFVVRKKDKDPPEVIYSGDSGFLNGSFYNQGGVCTDDSFERNF